MAPRGTPVIAAAPGTVEKLFFSQGGGGITAYVRPPGPRRAVRCARPGARRRAWRPGARGGLAMPACGGSPDRQWIFYYAHLDAYAPGLREGQAVAQGDPIGTVAFTGPPPPHRPPPPLPAH